MPRHPFDYRDLSAMREADLRRALLRELTDLYVQKSSHTAEEEQHFTELALRLIDHVDIAERARLGARLAAYPGAPLAVLLRLAEPEPAPHVSIPSLGDMRMPNLPRIDAPQRAETLSETFFNALPAERRLILLHLDYAAVTPARIPPIADATSQLERAAMTRQRDRFAAVLARLLSIASACAGRIADDTTGEAVIAALKALALPSPAVQRILLFLDPAIGQSAETYFALVKLYEDIGEVAARRLVTIWQRDHAAPEHDGRHRTQFFDDEGAHARDFSSHPARPAAGATQLPSGRRDRK